MKDYASMTDAEFYVECAAAVKHLAEQVLTIARQTAELAKSIKPEDASKVMGPALEFSMQNMLNGLGDILNGMDAATEEDEWTDAIFDEMQRRFPADA